VSSLLAFVVVSPTLLASACCSRSVHPNAGTVLLALPSTGWWRPAPPRIFEETGVLIECEHILAARAATAALSHSEFVFGYGGFEPIGPACLPTR
jgi:hypothetical protein